MYASFLNLKLRYVFKEEKLIAGAGLREVAGEPTSGTINRELACRMLYKLSWIHSPH